VGRWLSGFDTGMSSTALAMTVLGVPVTPSHPHDPSDLGRCLRLIERVPEAREAVDKLAATDPYWAALAVEWDALKASYDVEMASPKPPRRTAKQRAKARYPTYEMMRRLLDPVEKRDRSIIRISDGLTVRVSA